jgi:hypothetical protein
MATYNGAKTGPGWL